MFPRTALQICVILLLALPALARSRDVSGHYERNGENDQASLDVTMLPGDRVKVSGVASGTRRTRSTARTSVSSNSRQR